MFEPKIDILTLRADVELDGFLDRPECRKHKVYGSFAYILISRV